MIRLKWTLTQKLTFAIELNAILNYSGSYATEGNEIYQI